MNQFLKAGTGLLLLLLVAATPAVTAEDDDSHFWPKKMSGDKGEIVMYQPQIESFAGNILESRAAISVKITGQDEVVFGAMWFESHLVTDMETRTATLDRTKVTLAKFPNVEQAKVDELSAYLEKEIPTWDMEISIDRLLSSLPDDQDPSSDGFKGDPPVIHYRTAPAVLVAIDGDPIFTALNGFDLEYVANSAFFIVKDKKNGIFLRGAGLWFISDDIGGDWQQTTDLPSEVAKVSQKIDEEEAAQAAEQSEDAEALGLEQNKDEPAPEIIVSTVPAELIVTDGEADFASVEGTQLLYLKNTENDVLMDIADQRYYVLIAGRWYSAKSMDASSWDFVPFDELPKDFANIPASSDMATVLTSVPETTESKEAILETQIPQTAEVNRKTATCEVTYDGDPEFESCAEGVAYALNTEKTVLLIDKRYYCVDSAVWFESAGPEGPWVVSTEVPAVVQDLPPECPVYNVKYVYIYESTPEVVYVGYTSGYYSSYVWGPCVVYGTGWYYSPWWGTYYYPRPVTYGYGVHYSPYGGWGFSFGVSYGWLTIGVGWGRPPYYWGAGGYRYGYRRGYWRGYNRGYSHGYRRGASVGYRAGYRAGNRSPNQQSRNSNAYRNRKDGVNKTGPSPSDNRKRPATTGGKNNVYTDRNGDVYRDKDGSWEKRDGDKWSGTEGDRDKNKADDRSNKDRADQDRSDKSSRERDQQGAGDRSGNNKQQSDRDRSSNNQQMDRDRSGSSNQQLDRDRNNRSRGNERQRQSPSRSGGGSRGGGGRRR